MSRCRACNAPLYLRDTPTINPDTQKEEDLCITCKVASKHAHVEHEYIGGLNPQEGLTQYPENSE